MPELKVATSLYPLRLTAFAKSEVELTIDVTNESNEPYWVECSVQVPGVLSLVPDKDLAVGKKRIGLLAPGETLNGKCKIYSTVRTYPDVHEVKVTTFGYSRDGAVGTRDDKKVDLRCERLSIH